MQSQNSPWHPSGLLRRPHPVTDLTTSKQEEHHLHRAYSIPPIHALYIPGIRPQIGKDLYYQDHPESTLHNVGKWEQLMHEQLHISIAHTYVGALLTDLASSLYLLLYNLSDSMVLYIPSWHMDGPQDIAVSTSKTKRLLQVLDKQMYIFEEVLCAAFSFSAISFFHLQNTISDKVYDSYIFHMKDTLSHDNAMIWCLCEKLLRCIYGNLINKFND